LVSAAWGLPVVAFGVACLIIYRVEATRPGSQP
jgi:hypothetical protein